MVICSNNNQGTGGRDHSSSSSSRFQASSHFLAASSAGPCSQNRVLLSFRVDTGHSHDSSPPRACLWGVKTNQVPATGSPQTPKALAPPEKDEAKQKTSPGGWKGWFTALTERIQRISHCSMAFLYPFTDRLHLHQQPYEISSLILFYR